MSLADTGARPLPRALARVKKEWTALGENDPFWAVFTDADKKGGRWDPEAFYETGVEEIGRAIRTTLSLAPVQFGTAVDFGSGVGRLSQALSRHFEHVIGVEIAESMIRVANRFNLCPDRCVYLHNVAADLSILADGSADFVYSSITLQHIAPSQSRRYIREFFRIVRPGGCVVFQMPSLPRSRVKQLVKATLPVGFTNCLWRRIMGSAGAMESYFIPEAEVFRLVEGCSASVMLAESNQEGPLGWQSRKYFCVKDGGA